MYDDIIIRGSLLIDDKGKKYYLKEGYFDTEAFKTISKFKLPHTAHILDYSRNYLLSEYIEGTFLNGAVLSEQELYPMLVKICEAISELHRIGIIHLDIKPSDFVIDSNGQVQPTRCANLTDFRCAAIAFMTGQQCATAAATESGTRTTRKVCLR